MKMAIMQPYFFPYLGYFSLAKHVDEFMFFDTAQFIRHGWIERNRILKQNEGWLYIKVALKKHPQATPIKDVEIDNAQRWRETLLAQLQTYKKIAPYYSEVEALIKELVTPEAKNISELNERCFKGVCQYLGIDTPITVYSKENLKIETANEPDEWALNICKAKGGVDEYWNPPGGKSFFDRNKYTQADISLKFHEIHLTEYDQKRALFEPGLSIIDVLMFNSPAEVNRMLDDYEVE